MLIGGQERRQKIISGGAKVTIAGQNQNQNHNIILKIKNLNPKK